MRSNYQTQVSPSLNFVTEGDLEALHLATLEILERTGVLVHEAEALALLKSAGAIVDNQLVKIPAHLITKAVRSSPPRAAISRRGGERGMFLEDHKVYFGTGSDCPSIYDVFTGELRKTTIVDVERTAILCDALPNLDFMMSLGLASDVPPLLSDRYHFKAMVTNCEKPIVFTAWTKESLEDILDMAAIVAGGEKQLRERPFLILYNEAISPLVHAKEPLKKLMCCAERNIPVIYTTGGMAGGTVPATLAGALAVANAEILSALVIHQLKQEGAPFIFGGTLTIMDPATANFCHGAPEFHVNGAVLAALAGYYHLPVWGAAGCSDSKEFDQQAGIEASHNILMAALSGINLVHDVGYLAAGMIGSHEMLVAGDEVIGMVKRTMRGVEISDETLALDVIDEVGPGGNFLSHRHTVRHFRKEFWFPELIDRRGVEEWGRARSTFGERAGEKARRILTEHAPKPLPKAVSAELDGKLEVAAGKGSLPKQKRRKGPSREPRSS